VAIEGLSSTWAKFCTHLATKISHRNREQAIPAAKSPGFLTVMTTANDKEKGKEKESEVETPEQTKNRGGQLQDGKWYCDCDRKANCLMAKDKTKTSYGDEYMSMLLPSFFRET
jgi:hypothetical protein